MIMGKLILVLLFLLLGCKRHSELDNLKENKILNKELWKVTIDDNIFFIDNYYSWNDISEIVLEGKIILKDNYGNPNYGEDPETDKIESYYFLIPNNNIIYEYDFKNIHEIEIINEIQIVTSPEIIGKIYNVNYTYELFGNLFFSHTGHHHSRILIELTRINIKN